jgi:hypothetical protein
LVGDREKAREIQREGKEKKESKEFYGAKR